MDSSANELQPTSDTISRVFTNDATRDLNRPASGWPQVARVMALTPDFEAFQAFRDLNLKSLLYYQAQLVSLRKRLHVLEWKDWRNGNGPTVEFAQNLEYLFSSEMEADPRVRQQWELVRELRCVLNEYNQALLQYSQVSTLPKADSYNVESFRTWLKRSSGGNSSIRGPGADTWGPLYSSEAKPKSMPWQFLHLLGSFFWAPKPQQNELDLIVPRPGYQVDDFTQWVAGEFAPFYSYLVRHLGKRKRRNVSDVEKQAVFKPETYDFLPQTLSEEHQITMTSLSNFMVKLRSGFTTVAACLLPTLAIAILASVHHTAELIGLIGLFTALFAIGLMVFASKTPSTVEIFSATAVFSAVMVVFVQAQIGAH